MTEKELVVFQLDSYPSSHCRRGPRKCLNLNYPSQRIGHALGLAFTLRRSNITRFFGFGQYCTKNLSKPNQ